jgi:hypothetical protein
MAEKTIAWILPSIVPLPKRAASAFAAAFRPQVEFAAGRQSAQTSR